MPKYIDVEELKKLDFDKIFGYKASYETCLGIEAVLMVAEKMPSANVRKVKHGKWECGENIFPCFCSECGQEADMIYAYCPHCGAKMEVE